VVEDNATNQRVASLMLAKLGCQVDLASDGREAIQKWTDLDYDAVFMDCQMPGMNGFDATAEIRRRETAIQGNSRRTPIIAMTAGAMPSDKDHCLAAGMDDYVSKPVSLEVLGSVLRRLDGSSVAATEVEPGGPADFPVPVQGS
jgi:CheY-like chemotaxis protein